MPSLQRLGQGPWNVEGKHAPTIPSTLLKYVFVGRYNTNMTSSHFEDSADGENMRKSCTSWYSKHPQTAIDRIDHQNWFARGSSIKGTSTSRLVYLPQSPKGWNVCDVSHLQLDYRLSHLVQRLDHCSRGSSAPNAHISFFTPRERAAENCTNSDAVRLTLSKLHHSASAKKLKVDVGIISKTWQTWQVIWQASAFPMSRLCRCWKPVRSLLAHQGSGGMRFEITDMTVQWDHHRPATRYHHRYTQKSGVESLKSLSQVHTLEQLESCQAVIVVSM